MNSICIVQARMGSTRLPGKVMKKINGKPMISYTLNSLKKCKYIDKIVLATSNLAIDDELAAYVSENGFEIFRGSEKNVLERYKEVADKYRGDIITRITGDCPLINSFIVDNVITKYLVYNYDYVYLDVPKTFQRGFDVEVLSKEALDRVYNIVCSVENKNKEEYDIFREHVTNYIYNNPQLFRISDVKGEGKYYENRNINLSVDTYEDFQRVKNILENNEV